MMCSEAMTATTAKDPACERNRGLWKTMKFNCIDDLMFSHQNPRRHSLKFPLPRVTSHDLILSHTSFSEDAKNSKQEPFVGFSEDTLGAGKHLSPSKAAPRWQKISRVSYEPQETGQRNSKNTTQFLSKESTSWTPRFKGAGLSLEKHKGLGMCPALRSGSP